MAVGTRAVLIRGPSGSGKSDLALRLLMGAAAGVVGDAEVMLISDDQVTYERRANQIMLSPPQSIAGKLEVRGIGILEVAYRPEAPLGIIVDLVDRYQVPRMPEAGEHDVLLGLAVPKIVLWPFEASAPIKAALALWSTNEVGT